MFKKIGQSMLSPVCVICALVLVQNCVVYPAVSNAGTVEEFVLVDDGVSRAPIVIFEDAPPLTRQAGEELAYYIEKTSGARPEIIDGEPDPVPENAVWVGYQPVLEELFPDLDFDFQNPEEILVAASDSHLVIAGRDRWDDEHLLLEARRTINGIQQEYGTANAVCTFIQDCLDVRWLWPGELGVDIIERDSIAFEPFEYRYHPQFRQRSSVFVFSSLPHDAGVAWDWTRLQRLQLDSLDASVTGHGFMDWYDAYFDDHPEYFALQPNGSRSRGRNAKLCVSNPDVWERWIEHNVEGRLKIRPTQRVFVAGANDGWHVGHCICENCRAWDHPDAEPQRFRWEGISQMYVMLSDRHVIFANKLSELLKKRYPDRDYFVRIGAYGHNITPPIEAVPADNVIVGNVANHIIRPNMVVRGWQGEEPLPHRDRLTLWGETGVKQFWRPNTGDPAGWRSGRNNGGHISPFFVWLDAGCCLCLS